MDDMQMKYFGQQRLMSNEPMQTSGNLLKDPTIDIIKDFIKTRFPQMKYSYIRNAEDVRKVVISANRNKKKQLKISLSSLSCLIDERFD